MLPPTWFFIGWLGESRYGDKKDAQAVGGTIGGALEMPCRDNMGQPKAGFGYNATLQSHNHIHTSQELCVAGMKLSRPTQLDLV